MQSQPQQPQEVLLPAPQPPTVLQSEQQPMPPLLSAGADRCDAVTRDGLTKSLQERLLSRAAAKSGKRALVLEASERFDPAWLSKLAARLKLTV